MRDCAFPFCRNSLSEAVHENIIFCVQHQLLKRRVEEAVRALKLPDLDCHFIMDHLAGCTIDELACHLGICKKNLGELIRKGKVKARLDHHRLVHYVIPVNEIIRVIDLFRNWVTLHSVLKTKKLPRSSSVKYAREGFGGKVRENLSGYDVIHRSQLPHLRERFSEIKRAHQKNKGRKSYLREGELTTTKVAMLFEVYRSTPLDWIYRGLLSAKLRKRWWGISKKALRTFIDKALNGKINVKVSNRVLTKAKAKLFGS